jgi:hypothetical protein
MSDPAVAAATATFAANHEYERTRRRKTGPLPWIYPGITD